MGYSDPLNQAEYQRRWMKARRLAYFKGKVCSSCGSDSNLELDHIDPKEK